VTTLKTGAAIILTLIISACASSGGRRQVVKINSTPPGVKVFHDEELLGQTPFLTELPRKSSTEIFATDDNSKKQYTINGKYRWGRSFAGNLGFISLAPYGWLTDLITGAAWEYQEEIFLDLPPTKATGYLAPTTIAVAPPLSSHPNISDEVGGLISSDLSAGQAPGTVLSYNQTLPVFNDHSIDNDDHGGKTDLYETAYKTKATKVYFGSIDTLSNSDKVLVTGELRDVFNPELSKKMDFAFDKSLTPSLYDVGWAERRSEFLTLMPNSIFVIPTSSSTSLTINDQEVTADEVPANGFFEQTSRLLSAISLKNFLPPSKRPEWRYHFRLTPNLSFSYAREQFDEIPALDGVQFERFHTDIGWGPSFNYGNNRFNLYFNIFPTLGYDTVSTEWQGQSYREDNLGVTLGVELGFMMFIKERWSIQIFSRSASIPPGMWSEIISDVTKTSTDVDSASFIGGGIAVGYTFPNKDLPF
jgi:hypothetical protein